jgi:hypothetical protein
MSPYAGFFLLFGEPNRFSFLAKPEKGLKVGASGPRLSHEVFSIFITAGKGAAILPTASFRF